MNKVLILSYYFPPLGLGGVQRISKLCKYLKYFNWEPYVVTVKDIYYYQKDESLLQDLENITCIRTPSLDPLRLYYLINKNKKENGRKNSGSKNRFHFFEKYFFIPDSKKLWNPFAYKEAAKLIKKHRELI